MGAHSTIDITRSGAMDFLTSYQTRRMSDEMLARIMDVVLDERLYNVHIVPDHCENQDEKLDEL